MQNEVLATTKRIIENPQHVFIDYKQIRRTAKKFAKQELPLAKWGAPVYPSELNNETVDFLLLENAINFAFTDFYTKEKFEAEYRGISWKGAYGMVACLKRAMDKNIPIFNANFLENITRDNIREIFKGNMEIPMLEQRFEIFREVGEVLNKKYQGHFHNVVEASNNKLFDHGNGLVERLTNDFPSFNDSIMYFGDVIRFDKRAQLAGAMIYEVFQGTSQHQFEGIDDLTVFADYQLPKALNDLKIIKYEATLAKKIKNQELINPWSREEVEIRASTIHASDRLIQEINNLRDIKKGLRGRINALHMDFKLWTEGRKDRKTPHHLTRTIAY